MIQSYIIRYREGISEGKIWGTSLNKESLIKAIATENRKDNDYFNNHTDEQIWETIEKSGEFEMVTANYYE